MMLYFIINLFLGTKKTQKIHTSLCAFKRVAAKMKLREKMFKLFPLPSLFHTFLNNKINHNI